MIILDPPLMTDNKPDLSGISRITSIAEGIASIGSTIEHLDLKNIPLSDRRMSHLLEALRGELSSMKNQIDNNEDYINLLIKYSKKVL